MTASPAATDHWLGMCMKQLNAGSTQLVFFCILPYGHSGDHIGGARWADSVQFERRQPDGSWAPITEDEARAGGWGKSG